MARKKHGEHVSHERWLVSYADFITLLFAFFVVLYSTAQGDQKKAAQLAAAIQDAFQQLGVFPAKGAVKQLTVDIREFAGVGSAIRIRVYRRNIRDHGGAGAGAVALPQLVLACIAIEIEEE